MDAPKRIWICGDHHSGSPSSYVWHVAPSIHWDTGYILAVDHARIVAEKDAEIARLRKALTTIAEVRMVQGDEWPANNNFSMWLIARAALGDSHE